MECGITQHRRVYPRVCGGTLVQELLLRLALGLSPRVRGNQPDVLVRYFRHRSIPACAGEPWLLPAADALPAVYPRVCGGTPGIFPMVLL